MGGACGTYEGKEKCKAFVGIQKQRENFKDPSVDVSVILKWILNRLGRRVLD